MKPAINLQRLFRKFNPEILVKQSDSRFLMVQYNGRLSDWGFRKINFFAYRNEDLSLWKRPGRAGRSRRHRGRRERNKVLQNPLNQLYKRRVSFLELRHKDGGKNILDDSSNNSDNFKLRNVNSRKSRKNRFRYSVCIIFSVKLQNINLQ